MHDASVVVVTGASSGIGAATARLFGQQGWWVVLAARRRERLEALAQEIEGKGGRALAVPTDVTQWEQVQRLAEVTWTSLGRVDVLVNNAGLGRLNWLEAMDPQQDIARQIHINLVGAIWVVRAFLPGLLRQGFGHIINVASVASYMAMPTYSVYAATKFGLRGFTEALRREVEPLGLRVSAIYPGSVATEFGHHARGPLQRHGHTTPPHLVLKAEDVAHAIWQLARKPKRSKIVPWWFIPLLKIQAWFPGLMDRFTARTVRTLRGKTPSTSQNLMDRQENGG